jgi:hypothetical protein
MNTPSSNPPTTVGELFPSRWLKAEDLNGRSFNLTVTRVTIEELDGIQGKHWTVVLHFDPAAKKALALNKTQSLAMAEITGTEIIADWTGANIQLSPGVASNKKPTIIIRKAITQLQ